MTKLNFYTNFNRKLAKKMGEKVEKTKSTRILY